jgi:DeoR/GlpR family transcriptional regulator of sugar metabolism
VAARLAEIGGVVVLDAGVTNERVAAALDRDAGLTVVTAGPAIAAAALRVGVEVVLLGGVVDREIGAAVDATAVEALRGIRADAAVLGLCAVDADAGVTTARPAEVAFKRCLTAGAGEVIAAATADKLGTAAPYAVAPAAELTTIFALAPLPPGPALSLAERGVEVVEVGAVGQVVEVRAVGQVGKVGAVADPGRSVGR